MRYAVAAIALLALSSSEPVSTALAQAPVMQRDQTLHRTVDAGGELRVITYVDFHRDCKQMPPPNVVLRTPPAHGTVSLRPGPFSPTSISEGASDCRGQTYPGIGVWYVPEPGFHGTDRFDWDVMRERSVSRDTAIVSVK